MYEKRKDSKGRLLRRGESQRKDGKYEYKYTDIGGVRRTIYSWRLVETDKHPDGKRKTQALRTLEDAVKKDLLDGIDTNAANSKTLNDYIELNFSINTKWKKSTRAGYEGSYRRYIKDSIGQKTICSLKYSQIRSFLESVEKSHGIKKSSVGSIYSVINGAFKLALRDNVIRSNPVEGMIREISLYDDGESEQVALSAEWQDRLIDFVSTTPDLRKHLNLITVFLGTGMRSGELCGLTWSNCDFKNNVIHVKQQAQYVYDYEEKRGEFIISSPKSKSGYRDIPMLDDVKNALLKIQREQFKSLLPKPELDNQSGFVFITASGKVISNSAINYSLKRIRKRYNETETLKADRDNRAPELMPKLTAHILRHSFCTRLCEAGTNIKVIQDIMGHSTITTTMDIYANLSDNSKREGIEKLELITRIS